MNSIYIIFWILVVLKVYALITTAWYFIALWFVGGFAVTALTRVIQAVTKPDLTDVLRSLKR